MEIMSHQNSEADTRAEWIDPKLAAASWCSQTKGVQVLRKHQIKTLDAEQVLGSLPYVNKLFIGFQRHLYAA